MTQLRTSRRNFIAAVSAIVPAAVLVPKLAAQQTTGTQEASASAGGPYKLPPLRYDYSALEPHIDEQTMRIHHDKHHEAYVKNLNIAIQKHPELGKKNVDELLADLNAIPEDIRDAVRNNGGGHSNHTMFWKLMTPGGAKQPPSELASAINSTFDSLENFKTRFEEAGTKRFGSGWVWLVSDHGKLDIVSTPNQDSPVSNGQFVILGNDVWEHAYYLKYQNKRADYLKAWWNVVNWDYAAERFKHAPKA